MSAPVMRDVRKIAVFRPNAVGDFMFCLPALHALKQCYPEAEIVYLGLPWHADFLAGRPGPIDRVVVVPPMPGIRAGATGAGMAVQLRSTHTGAADVNGAKLPPEISPAAEIDAAVADAAVADAAVADTAVADTADRLAGSIPEMALTVDMGESQRRKKTADLDMGNHDEFLEPRVPLSPCLATDSLAPLSPCLATDSPPPLSPCLATDPRVRRDGRFTGHIGFGESKPVHEAARLPPSVARQHHTVEAKASDADGFVAAMRGEKFDLALQMFGGGRHANPLVAQFRARLSVGMRTADAAPLDRCIAYGALVNRRLQLLELAALAGAKAWPMKRQLQATGADRQLAAQLVPSAPGQRLVIVQPGASDPRRRWPAARFAAVADALVEEGALVAINGSPAEAEIVSAVIAAMRYPALDLSGKASLNALCGLLERAVLMVSNDTGPLHMALALDRPCVGIYWFTNLCESAPLCQHRHRSALSTRLQCPVCGMENLTKRCEHDVSFLDTVSVEEVTALSIELFRAER